jgi:NAD-reducing hydrogenase small subunit
MPMAAQNAPQRKLKVATTSLAGCFGCHMSLLDIDERVIDLAKVVEFDRSPIDDIKHCGPCDIGIVEGAVCNSENVHVLREFRANCKVLIACGACAVNGGLPALRNHLDAGEMLKYIYGDPDAKTAAPSDPELPLLLDKVRPLNEIVRIDYFIPGCPPSGETIWKYVTDLISGNNPRLGFELLRYD